MGSTPAQALIETETARTPGGMARIQEAARRAAEALGFQMFEDVQAAVVRAVIEEIRALYPYAGMHIDCVIQPSPSPTDPSPSAGGDNAGTPSLREASSSGVPVVRVGSGSTHAAHEGE